MIPPNGGALAIRTWPGSEPGVLLVHASGFCKELWDPVVGAFGDDPVAAVAFDQRGHGESPPMPFPMDWGQLGTDVADIAAEADIRPRVGVGHSSGGAAIAIAAINDPDLFEHLVLIEPIITPPPHVRREDHPMAIVAERRQLSFPDRSTARRSLAGKRSFRRWVPEALDAYVAGGLADDGDRVVLRCAPETEAEHYRSGLSHPTWDHLGEIARPVTLIVGSESTTHHGTFLDGLVERFSDVELIVVSDASHFVPMEYPEVIAGAILKARDAG